LFNASILFETPPKILFNFLQVFKANKLGEIVAPNAAIFCYDEACFIFIQ